MPTRPTSMMRLMKLDFMVCADLFMTPTAELADIVLPAAAWPELDQLAGLPTVAANVVLAQQKAVQIGECKSDEEIFVALAQRMKLPVCTEPVKSVLDAQLAAGGLNMTFDELKQKGFYQGSVQVPKIRERRIQDADRQDRTLFHAVRTDLAMRRCPTTKSHRKARSARPKLPRNIRWCSRPVGGFRSSSTRSIANSPSCARRNAIRWRKFTPKRRRASASSTERGCGSRRERGRMRQKAKLTDWHRPARHPRPARLVVSRAAGPRVRRLDVKCQSLDRQPAAL